MIRAVETLLVTVLLKSKAALLQKLVPPNYLYKKGSYRYLVRNGVKYMLDLHHVVDHYFYFGLDNNIYKSITEDIRKAKVIIDIGANIGITSLYFASLNPKAKIFAFEPHPETFKRARENFGLNNFKNIQLINLGLGNRKASMRLYEVEASNPGMNRIMNDEQLNIPYCTIEIEMLDDVLTQYNIQKVDFIKMDVEGFEHNVLMGAVKTLHSHPVLVIELDDSFLRENKSSPGDLIHLLYSTGYNNIYNAITNKPILVSSDFKNCHFDLVAK